MTSPVVSVAPDTTVKEIAGLLLKRGISAVPVLEAEAQRYDVGAVRALCAFTTHTPVDAGHDKFSYDLVLRVLGPQTDIELLKDLPGEQHLNMTQLALSLSEYVNGVAKRHAEVCDRMFSGYRVHAVTNGVHPYAWTCDSLRELHDRHLPRWYHEPEMLVRIGQVGDDELWQAHLRELGGAIRGASMPFCSIHIA